MSRGAGDVSAAPCLQVAAGELAGATRLAFEHMRMLFAIAPRCQQVLTLFFPNQLTRLTRKQLLQPLQMLELNLFQHCAYARCRLQLPQHVVSAV